METVNLTYPHDLLKENLPETVAAIGFFDGVHKGHQAVIQKAVQLAKKDKKTSAVISFYPHPSVVLQKNVTSASYITPQSEKETMFASLGVDKFYIISFNKELSLLSPKDFIDHFIIGLHIKHLVAGFDFTYGHKGKGNMENIDMYQNGAFQVSALDKVEVNGEKASSTNIRNALKEGEVNLANHILGRHFTTTGNVITGDKRGREMGFPTANLQIDDEKLLPKMGVYAVRITVKGKTYDGMASLGLVPTFKDDLEHPVAEVNILDFDEDIYDETVTVYWYEFIRPELKFDGMENLIAQMKEDEVQIRQYFKELNAE